MIYTLTIMNIHVKGDISLIHFSKYYQLCNHALFTADDVFEAQMSESSYQSDALKETNFKGLALCFLHCIRKALINDDFKRIVHAFFIRTR